MSHDLCQQEAPYVHVTATNVVQCLAIHYHCDIRMLKQQVARKTVLYGSTTAVATCGQAHTTKLSFDASRKRRPNAPEAETNA